MFCTMLYYTYLGMLLVSTSRSLQVATVLASFSNTIMSLFSGFLIIVCFHMMMIGVLIEDKDFVDSSMGGKPWKAGKFASSLRHSFWSEHLGLHAGEIGQIIDPVIDPTYKDIWMATAKTNTMIYQDVFFCIPNDLIQSRCTWGRMFGPWDFSIKQIIFF